MAIGLLRVTGQGGYGEAVPRRDVRRLAIDAAARLFGTDGYHGTGLTKILDESGAPKGSFYFHFPEGKEQLAEEAIAAASAQMEEFIFFSIEQATRRGQVIEHLASALQRRLVDSDFAMGGPITSLTLETAHLSERLRTACAAAYGRWIELLAEHLRSAGSSKADATEVATLIISALEGSLALAKALRDPTLVVRSAKRLTRLLG